MTTIASFATLTRETPESKRLLSSVYILSDSKWTWPDYSQPNMQKIFYSREASLVMTYTGDARLGFQISSMVTNQASTDPSIRRPSSMKVKIDRINALLNQLLQNIPSQERKMDSELFGVFSDGHELKAYSFFAKKNQTAFDRSERAISDQTNIYTSGSGGEYFLKTYNSYLVRNKDIPEAAIYFHSFIQFLNSEVDALSSIPPQAVVINQHGIVKPVSIKIGDEFYKLGNKDDERANYKQEIDYRDTEFEFLHADGTIKGQNRKKYHINKS
jgi:hypothetical protein